jgi:hypothetical protein
MGVLFLVARQLVASAAAARGVAIAMIGLAGGLAAIAVHQSLVTIPADTRAYQAVADNPAALYELTGQWMPAESRTREQFEARLESALPSATFALSNSLAGFVVPWFVVPWFVVLSAVAFRSPGRIVAGACGVIAALMVVCIWLTGSRTAGVAVIAGGLLLLAICSRESLFRLSRRTVWLAAGGVLLAAIVAGTTLFATSSGRSAAEAALRSVAYRAEYWQATARMIADDPLFGCGPGQFQDTYTAYKLPAAAEEVQDPHNWLLEVWATAGTPAAVALLAVLAVVVVRVMRRGGSMPDAGDGPECSPSFSLIGSLAGIVLGVAISWLSGFTIARTHIALLVVVVVGVWWMLRGWIRSGAFPPSVPLVAAAALLVNLSMAGGIGYPSVAESLWLLLAIALNVAVQTDAKPQAEAKSQADAKNLSQNRPQRGGQAHFTPKTPQNEPVPDGSGIGSMPQGDARSRRLRYSFDAPLARWVVGLALAAMLAMAIRVEYLPVLAARLQWALADDAIARGQAGPYRDAVEQAVAADRWSVPAAARLAALRYADYEALSTDTQLDRYLQSDQRVRELAPRRSGIWAISAERAAAIFRATENVEHRDAAGRYYERAIELYPTDGRLLADAATFWHTVGDADRAARAAIDALACDDAQRTAGHRDRQLSDSQRSELASIAARATP